MKDTASLPLNTVNVSGHSRTRWQFWRRFRQNRLAIVGLAIVLVYFAVALAAPFFPLPDPNEVNTSIRLKGPGTPGHLLGTDELGRDILSRLVWGGRPSMMSGFFAAFLSAVIGCSLGLLSGYFGGKVDGLIMRMTDVVMAFPAIVLALAVVTMLGPGLVNAMLAVGIVGFPLFARLVRGSVLSLREREFIEAARALGASDNRIMLRHILPNAWAPVIVTLSLDIGVMVIATSALSFLGLGSRPPDPDWGAMLSTGRNMMVLSPHVATIPGLAIFVFVLGFNLLGDGLRDALDPRLHS